MTERGIHGLLQAFFAQKRISDPPNGYSKPGWVNQIRNSGDNFIIDLERPAPIPLDDEESGMIEPVMCMEKQDNPHEYTILELYYRFSLSDAKIARMCLFAEDTGWVNVARKRAEYRIAARLGI